ncbi:MAG TPA: hypothetical protein VHV49_11205 [Pseudonocardiaceae bacterium]|jgi:hypothetical protein|nr:hypothetical protein [Pseudonocardiaceae bacterium]
MTATQRFRDWLDELVGNEPDTGVAGHLDRLADELADCARLFTETADLCRSAAAKLRDRPTG